MNVVERIGLIAVAASALASPGFAQSTAYRITDLDLRDPHLFIDFLGCRDITDNTLLGFSINGDLQARLQTDGDGDGLLDLSLLLVFDPLDQMASGGPIRFGQSNCTAPAASTSCGPAPFENLVALVATNSTIAQCLAPFAGTLRPYTPAVFSTPPPCFATAEATLVLDVFNGVPMTLRFARVAAAYVGAPATGLASGLIRGFLTEADADNTIFPASHPVLGGLPLSQVLPGGDPPGSGVCCASHSDQDVVDGETGWWMYFNFTAAAVPYTGPQASVTGRDGAGLALTSPNPSRLPLAVAYRLEAEGPARLSVHDLSGRLVAELANGPHASGTHTLTWGGGLDRGGAAPPGIYVIRLASAAGGTIARRVAVLR